ncbi:MAG TPA: tetratricopeptide repeat protein [Terriglobales bacterium]|nr:tetratricopeptide repeat protein [Terriglobales bacterium]
MEIAMVRRLFRVLELSIKSVIAGGLVAATLLTGIYSSAQSNSGSMPNLSGAPNAASREPGDFTADKQAEAELEKGTALTRSGKFAEAIPHLLAARGRVANNYAANFNLALCYVATGQSQPAIPVLTELRASGHDNANVNNLLAQAYIGDSQDQKAFESTRRAAALDPANEKLYTFVADACTFRQNYSLGLQVVDLGLSHLPNSARLHFERAMFLSSLDQFDNAKNDFELARSLAPDSDIAFLAAAQEAFFEGNIAAAVRAARDGISKGHESFMLLTLLGEALLRSGITPGQPEFEEARGALETAVSQRPDYASSQLTLGKLYLLEGRLADAIVHLEIARQLNPENAAIYSNLAAAYRKQGRLAESQDALSKLSKLNQAQAAKIRDAPGDRKASYAQNPQEHKP